MTSAPAVQEGAVLAYLEARAAHSEPGSFEHYVVGPEALSSRELERVLRRAQPDVVLMHEPFSGPFGSGRAARACGAPVVAVRHDANAATASLQRPEGRGRLARRHTIALRRGIEPEFRIRHEVRRKDHVVYAGPLDHDHGLFALLEAAARSLEPWSLRLIGDGPAEDGLARRAERLGIADRVTLCPRVRDRDRLARIYAGARCVVVPAARGSHCALEAVACGARVVASVAAPQVPALGDLVHVFIPGEVEDLGLAIAAARAAAPDPLAATALAFRHRWPRVFDAEVAALRQLLAAG